MMETNSIRKNRLIVCMSVICILLITVTGCKTRENGFTIGVVSSNEYEKTPTWQGFSDGMAKAGYIEGRNVRYIIKKVPENDEQKIDAAIKEVLGQNPDLILTMGGNAVDLRAEELVKKNNIPALFGTGAWPVRIGLVDSISHPGGNITGVQGVDCTPEGPGISKIDCP